MPLQFHFSLQVSPSTPARLSDFANYRLGVIESHTGFTATSTGIAASYGVALTHSPALTPSVLDGTAKTTGASVGEGLVVGYDKGNIDSMIGNTPAPTSETISVGQGLTISPISGPLEIHGGASTTNTVSISLGEIYNSKLSDSYLLPGKDK